MYDNLRYRLIFVDLVKVYIEPANYTSPTHDVATNDDNNAADEPYDPEKFEGDGLPNIEWDGDVIPFQDDHNICDDAETITFMNNIPDDMPFYANQEADPTVAALMSQYYSDDSS